MIVKTINYYAKIYILLNRSIIFNFRHQKWFNLTIFLSLICKIHILNLFPLFTHLLVQAMTYYSRLGVSRFLPILWCFLIKEVDFESLFTNGVYELFALFLFSALKLIFEIKKIVDNNLIWWTYFLYIK